VAAGSLESIRQKPNPGKDTTAVKKPYHIVSREADTAAATVEQFAKANGQILLPLVELSTQARLAVDEVIDRIGRQTIETILNFSAEQVAGVRTPGKNSGDVRWHGSQNGRVSLANQSEASAPSSQASWRSERAGIRIPTREQRDGAAQDGRAAARRFYTRVRGTAAGDGGNSRCVT
jgi:hypothetical protein